VSDICALFAAEHASLAQLATQLHASQRPAAAQRLFKHFAAALGGHLTAVRRVIYPALKAIGWNLAKHHGSDHHGPHLHVADWIEGARLLMGGLGPAGAPSSAA
jgi:hypothetical protein